MGSSVYVFKISEEGCNFEFGNNVFLVVSEIIDTAAPVSMHLHCEWLIINLHLHFNWLRQSLTKFVHMILMTYICVNVWILVLDSMSRPVLGLLWLPR